MSICTPRKRDRFDERRVEVTAALFVHVRARYGLARPELRTMNWKAGAPLEQPQHRHFHNHTIETITSSRYHSAPSFPSQYQRPTPVRSRRQCTLCLLLLNLTSLYLFLPPPCAESFFWISLLIVWTVTAASSTNHNSSRHSQKTAELHTATTTCIRLLVHTAHPALSEHDYNAEHDEQWHPVALQHLSQEAGLQ
jgi:hypothetical protein